MAGYVGRGMLAAAVCGEVFASPSEDAVLAAIRAVTGPAGGPRLCAGRRLMQHRVACRALFQPERLGAQDVWLCMTGSRQGPRLAVFRGATSNPVCFNCHRAACVPECTSEHPGVHARRNLDLVVLVLCMLQAACSSS